MNNIEERCREFITDRGFTDAAHDLAHITRVLGNARTFARNEGGEPAIVIPAAWLHDCVVLPKNDPAKNESSRMAARTAREFLMGIEYPNRYIPGIIHAIEAHSFGAGIPPETLEAKIVQDADRIDALGAIGIARCLLTGGRLNRPLYADDDPFCRNRSPRDDRFTIDHFYAKLFALPDSLHTRAARNEAIRRVSVMRSWLEELAREIT